MSHSVFLSRELYSVQLSQQLAYTTLEVIRLFMGMVILDKLHELHLK